MDILLITLASPFLINFNQDTYNNFKDVKVKIYQDSRICCQIENKIDKNLYIGSGAGIIDYDIKRIDVGYYIKFKW